MSIRVLLACALTLAACPSVLGAEPESEHVGHTRHHHPHNPKHATVDDPGRFYTDRDSPVELPLPSEEDAFSFVIFGDRTGGPDSGVSILADAVRDTNLIEPDLVMTVGDLIDGYNESDEWMEEMREYRAIMSKLICPWFPVAGNHDVYWRDQGKGETRPDEEHEGRYELHFGPLWYAFEHKNSFFIVLYTDEGNPETGERNFNKPESQRMSPEQKSFLADALELGKDAEHVFVFVHHPRWLKGRYGDDWDSVHEMLVRAGNVSAVFAGHIHYMRYDGPRDGIEYVSLATVGGGQSGAVPQAGFLHQYHLITVRRDQIAMSSIPVGEIMDVRDITGDLARQAYDLSQGGVEVSGRVLAGHADEASGLQSFGVRVWNPTEYAMDYTVALGSADARWSFPEDHTHGTLAPGASRELRMSAYRPEQPLDEGFRPVEVRVDREMLTKSFRYTIPTRTVRVPTRLKLEPSHGGADMALRTGQGAWAEVESGLIDLPDGPMTLECWFRGDRFDGRRGLVAKTEGSEFGFFVSDGRPQFSIFLGDRYVEPGTPGPVLEPDRWYHIAGVYDGQEVRLYLDGRLVASEPGSGVRRRNALPMMIGADVNGRGEATSFFSGEIDGVRLSSTARYTGESFMPGRTPISDSRTVGLWDMDSRFARWIIDRSSADAHGTMEGGVELVEP